MRLIVKERGGRHLALPLRTDAANAVLSPNEDALSIGERACCTINLDTEGESFRHAFLYLNDDEDENLLGEIDETETDFWKRDDRNVKKPLNSKPFIGQVDFTRFVLRVITDSDEEIIAYSPLLLCVTEDERDAENIHAMLEALLNFDDDFVTNAMFEHRSDKSPSALVRGSLAQCSYKPFRVYLNLLEKIVAAYAKNATCFQRKAHFRISRQDKLMNIHEVREVRADDVMWLAHHAESLSEMPNETGVEVDGKYYLPLRLQSADKYNSRDVYENRAVYSFLITVQKVAARFYRQLEEAIQQGKSALAHYTSFTASGKAPIITIKRYLVDSKSVDLQRLGGLMQELQHLLLRYRSFLPCPDGVLKEMPKATKIFLNNQAYREIFNLMHDWFHYGEMSISGNLLVFRIKEVSKLFEYYCLQRLLQQIKQDGFVIQDDGAKLYHYPAQDSKFRMDTEVCNTYRFSKGDVELVLYYEPVLYSFLPESFNELPNGLTLYRSDCALNQRKSWTPDFVIKLKKGECQQYAILDSKYSFNFPLYGNQSKIDLYSSQTQHKEPHFNEIVSKYAWKTSALPQSTIKLVFTLQGRSEGKGFIYHENAASGLLGLRNRLGANICCGNCPVSAIPHLDQTKYMWALVKRSLDEME